MKPAFFCSAIFLLMSLNLHAQKQPDPIKSNIEKAHRAPQTHQRAAMADVLLVHSPKWSAGRSTLPAHSSIVPDSLKLNR